MIQSNHSGRTIQDVYANQFKARVQSHARQLDNDNTKQSKFSKYIPSSATVFLASVFMLSLSMLAMVIYLFII